MKKIKMVRVGLDVDSSYPEYSYEVETETHKIPAYRMQVQVSEDVIERWDKASKAYAEIALVDCAKQTTKSPADCRALIYGTR